MFGAWLYLFSPALDAVERTLEICFIYPFVVMIVVTRFKRNNCGCSGLMLDHPQHIHDAECLPFYRW